MGSRVAQALVASAQEGAKSAGLAISVAAVQAGGNLVAVARMTGLSLLSIDMAIGKAYTATVAPA